MIYTNSTIKLGMFNLTLYGNYNIQLPKSKYSKCLPLLIYSNNSPTPGAYVKYFFNLTTESLNFTINYIEPETFPISYIEPKASSISIFGERFSPDMRCFIEDYLEQPIEEVQFFFSNESYAGCLLPYQLQARLYKVRLYRRGCNAFVNITKPFQIENNLSIIDETGNNINKTSGKIQLKYKIIGIAHSTPNMVVVIYNDIYYFLNNNEDRIILKSNTTENNSTLFFDVPIIDPDFYIQISLDYGTTFTKFHHNFNTTKETCLAGYFCIKKNEFLRF